MVTIGTSYLVTVTVKGHDPPVQREAKIAAAFGDRCEAYMLVGMLLVMRTCRTINVWSIAPDGAHVCRFQWGDPFISEDWCETTDLEWEACLAHEAPVVLWVQGGRQEPLQGVLWANVCAMPLDIHVAEGAGLWVATLGSSARRADDGPRAEAPGELPW